MNIPKFTAEATLYRTTAYQTAAVAWARTASYRAYPQIILPPPPPLGPFTSCTPCDPTSRSQTCTNPFVAGPWNQPCTPCCSSEQDCQQCDVCLSAGTGVCTACDRCGALKLSGTCNRSC